MLGAILNALNTLPQKESPEILRHISTCVAMIDPQHVTHMHLLAVAETWEAPTNRSTPVVRYTTAHLAIWEQASYSSGKLLLY
jgi:hypothetical protein